jgi:very-short-patch-repair endonuclease
MLISRLISRLPNFDAFSSNGEMGLLRREMAKQRRLMPTRLLIAALPNLLPALKPCMMMSPLSVSTFLGSSNYEFDTVIFDEASQIRTEDAIGAIFRADQAIIAGDSKQLPPTDFFSSYMSGSDEFEEDEGGGFNDTGAYESLLDEATLLPTQTLLWHYRSRHEHLITFSNAKIYQGNLITFPSSVEKNDGMGVEYIHVAGGRYDRGGRNGNKAEAEKVAELVFSHFEEYPDRSLGIIAFGEVQQSAIQDALIAKRRERPEFEPFFKDSNEEALFIKNLETVQGDERDTIIFSIGYAPDATGKFIMNFGPLSRDGGERRLNVAVTRARYNLKLVGSIMPTDIDVDRISGQGPKLLRLYIDFAINGPNAILGEITASDGLYFDSDFEVSVYEFLAANGFDVSTQVGCSGYRIDMAVRHPQYNGGFAIGVECDGAMYHSARTARERDRLRQTVLEDMGWVIYRVWSTDWIKDRNTEGERLLNAVQAAIDNYRGFVPTPTHGTAKMTGFVSVSTQTPTERMQEGMAEKYRTLQSRYYGWNTREIPIGDMGDVMLKVIAMNYGLDKVGLFKETAFYGYGWERQGSVIKQQFERAFRSLIQQNKIEIDSDEKVQLVE